MAVVAGVAAATLVGGLRLPADLNTEDHTHSNLIRQIHSRSLPARSENKSFNLFVVSANFFNIKAA
jgi:hypothetical protein